MSEDNNSQELAKKTILVCMTRPERVFSLNTTLAPKGYEVITATSVSSALEACREQLPHFVIFETIVNDGTIADFHQQLNANPMFSQVPLIAFALSKSPKDLYPCKGLHFSGVIIGKIDAQQVMRIINNLPESKLELSPYFIPVDEFEKKDPLHVTIPLFAVGQIDDHVVFESEVFIDDFCTVTCHKRGDDREKNGAQLNYCHNLANGNGKYFNLVPMSKIKGPGRKWMTQLPKLEHDSFKEERRVVIVHPDKAYYENFASILAGYQIESIYANHAKSASVILQQDPDSFPVFFFPNFVDDPSKMDWTKAMEQVPTDRLPSMIIGTKHWYTESMGRVRYLKMPFGLENFLTILDSSFLKYSDIDSQRSKFANTRCVVEFDLALEGVDEKGGFMSSNMRMVKGSQVKGMHPLYMQLGHKKPKLEVLNCRPAPHLYGQWQVHFRLVGPDEEKRSFYDKVLDLIDVESFMERLKSA